RPTTAQEMGGSTYHQPQITIPAPRGGITRARMLLRNGATRQRKFWVTYSNTLAGTKLHSYRGCPNRLCADCTRLPNQSRTKSNVTFGSTKMPTKNCKTHYMSHSQSISKA